MKTKTKLKAGWTRKLPLTIDEDGFIQDPGG